MDTTQADLESQLALITELEKKQAEDVRKLQSAKLYSCQRLATLQSGMDHIQVCKVKSFKKYKFV